MSDLLKSKLEEYTGHHVSFLVDGGEVFTGRLKMHDEDVLVFDDIVDSRGDKGKELMVSIGNVLWMILED